MAAENRYLSPPHDLANSAVLIFMILRYCMYPTREMKLKMMYYDCRIRHGLQSCILGLSKEFMTLTIPATFDSRSTVYYLIDTFIYQ